jgi:XTP/dITP diphosphohydrolase
VPQATPAVVLVTTSRHTPPGLLAWPAWQALQAAVVLVPTGHPQLEALRQAGVRVEQVDGQLEDRLAERAAGGEAVVGLPLPGHLPAVPGARVVVGSTDPGGARLLDVVALMDRLRSPGGCPWDAEQTHRSLMPYLLEEAYEAYQALEDDDPAALREELGDVLLQVVFHARLAQEAAEPWSVDDVAGDLVDKLVRRHPHVFAGTSADDLETTWDALKAAEKGRTSVTEGVPLGQPSLSLAAKLQKRATRLGAPVPAYGGLGGALWDLVRACRAEGVDAEAALRDVSRRFRDALAAAERDVRDAGGDPAAVSGTEWGERLAGLSAARGPG